MNKVTNKETVLLSSKEVELFLNKKFSIEILDSWAKENSVFYDGTYIWSLDNLDNFLYGHLKLFEILSLKIDNNVPLSETEKKSIVLNENNDLSIFYNKLSYNEIIEIKNKYSIPISGIEKKIEISEQKKQYEENVASEKLIIENYISEQKETVREENEKYNERLKSTLSNYEEANISRLRQLSQPTKYGLLGCFSFLIICFILILGFFLFFIM